MVSLFVHTSGSRRVLCCAVDETNEKKKKISRFVHFPPLALHSQIFSPVRSKRSSSTQRCSPPATATAPSVRPVDSSSLSSILTASLSHRSSIGFFLPSPNCRLCARRRRVPRSIADGGTRKPQIDCAFVGEARCRRGDRGRRCRLLRECALVAPGATGNDLAHAAAAVRHPIHVQILFLDGLCF